VSVPRPGFSAGFLATFARALRSSLGWKRALILLAVLAVPPALAIPARLFSPSPHEALNVMTLFLHLQFLAPVTGLLFGIGILADEVGGGTLPYLFTRPVPRSSILLGKFAAAVLLGWVAVSISLGLMLAVFGEVVPVGFTARAMAATLLVMPAYLAAFALLSALTRWGLLVGFLYAFGLEGFLSLIPGMVKEVTLLYYSRSLLGKWSEQREFLMMVFGEERIGAEPLTSVVVLGAVAVVALVGTLLVIRRREFVARPQSA
jgi:ABC-type transport system involved in multi-copper enzyme maturation permease subunit